MKKLPFPTWKKLRIPESFVHLLRNLHKKSVLLYLAENRIYHEENPVCYTFCCASCSESYFTEKTNESYYKCALCGKKVFWTMPNYRYYVDNLADLMDPETGASSIIEEMRTNYKDYFGKCPDNFVSLTYGTSFGVQFLGGELSLDKDFFIAAIKAALCTPFLWDISFNWQTKLHGDCDPCLNLTEFLHQICCYETPNFSMEMS